MHIHTTERRDGDFGIDAEPSGLADRRRSLVDRPWVWLRQVHGAEVAVVRSDAVDEVAGRGGDALVTTVPGIVLTVQTADCVPVALWSDGGVVAVAHAGWRGLEAGVVEATVAAMRDLGATTIHAAIGPHLRVGANEFGPIELDRLAERFGDEVRGTTDAGRPAFDIDVALASVVADIDVIVDRWDPSCTATDADRWFSHRARREPQRMATAIWMDLIRDGAP